ncbi:MAG: hypothetical protein QNJ91_14815 [Gammaproteobacteria bacterium]|nr:hypothetical protein [Gammaproteobacteria bacterium]
MPGRTLKTLLTVIVIALLHAPLIAYALWLRDDIGAAQSVVNLPWSRSLPLIVLLILPYAALSLGGIRWNPSRAQLNEPLDD